MGRRQLVGQLPQRRLAPGDERDAVAALRQLAGEVDADARRGSGDQAGAVGSGGGEAHARIVGPAIRTLPHQRVTWSMHLGGDPEAAEVALLVPHEERGVLQVRHEPLGVRERDDVVGVAVPPPDRHVDLVRLEAPVAREEDPVGEERSHAAAAVLGEVVEEHLLHVRAG